MRRMYFLVRPFQSEVLWGRDTRIELYYSGVTESRVVLYLNPLGGLMFDVVTMKIGWIMDLVMD